jgi:hypothetical protein
VGDQQGGWMAAIDNALLLLAGRAEGRWATGAAWLLRRYWLVRGIGHERELALRWRRPRYRLMVTTFPAGGEEVNWVREVDGKFIPICTRREGERRRAAFLRTHPGWSARLERARMGRLAGAAGRCRDGAPRRATR